MDGPATRHTSGKDIRLGSEKSCPLRDRQRHALVGENTIAPGVVCLVACRSPLAIGRGVFCPAFVTAATLVAAVVVNAIYAVSGGRPGAHVAEERHEVIGPSLADADASAAVIRIALIIWVGAAALHMAPDPMFWPLAHAVSFVDEACLLSLEAPTASAMANDKNHFGHDLFGAAIAAAKPGDALPPMVADNRVADAGYRRPSAEPIAGKVTLGAFAARGRRSPIQRSSLRGSCVAAIATALPDFATTGAGWNPTNCRPFAETPPCDVGNANSLHVVPLGVCNGGHCNSGNVVGQGQVI